MARLSVNEVREWCAEYGLKCSINAPGDRYGTRYQFCEQIGYPVAFCCGAKEAEAFMSAYAKGYAAAKKRAQVA